MSRRLTSRQGVRMYPQITLASLTREDVQRLADWLKDDEVNSLWYGLGEDGEPLHIGYSPQQALETPEAEWAAQSLAEEDRKIYSIYSSEEEHIGEGQLLVEWPLLEAQLFLLIGRKDLWHHHYGTSALVALLDEAFNTLELHRVWVDVPEYNEHALQVSRRVGFVLEGHFRKTHRKDDNWYDSFAMGLLADEYARRRAWLMSGGA